MRSGTDARPFGSFSPSRVLKGTLGYSRWVLQPLHDRLALLVVLEPCEQPLAVLRKLSAPAAVSYAVRCPPTQTLPIRVCSVITLWSRCGALWPRRVSDASGLRGARDAPLRQGPVDRGTGGLLCAAGWLPTGYTGYLLLQLGAGRGALELLQERLALPHQLRRDVQVLHLPCRREQRDATVAADGRSGLSTWVGRCESGPTPCLGTQAY
jgi:hypothetical protein